MKPIQIAIIGYGKIAEDQHVPSIRPIRASSWSRHRAARARASARSSPIGAS